MNVALYIYSPKYINSSIAFTADNTEITADSDLYTADQTILGGNEGFFNVSQRIELYNDEKINITSSVQDISNPSKAFTDFSQSFTIPASKTNNVIFKHWYESAIDGGFDQRIKYDGYIEINTLPFRVGGFALNSVNLKNNKPESYNITFYGNSKSIKDLFKEDKLSSLDFSDLNHLFNETEVVNRITSDSESVAYPLFANDRLYTYNDGGSDDITTVSGAISFDSLFPAVSLPTIIQKIEDKYNLTFTGSFLDYVQFSKLWMLFKNEESLIVKTEPQLINFTTKDVELSDRQVNLDTDEIGFNTGTNLNYNLRINITPTDPLINYNILVYKNGVLFSAFQNQTGTTLNTFFNGLVNSQNVDDKYTLYIQSDLPLTYTAKLDYQFVSGGFLSYEADAASNTTIANINISSYAPDLKLIDFFNGLIKMFNLVVVPVNTTTFELIPLELYYNNGVFRDISKNVIIDDLEIKKTSMYKNINFKYQSSDNILNNKFNELFTPQRGFDYGDLTYEQIDSLESNTLSVDLPFENPIYERKTNSSFQTITFKNKDLNNYVPKPLLMYDNGLESVSLDIKIDSFNVSNYRRFSNDIDNGGLLTLNWGEEVSQWVLNASSDGLYKRHYSNYLGNIFNLKGRLIIAKCKFSPIELTSIKLNDRIVIRDKRYTINKLNADLTTGETTLELLTDYRVGEVSIGNRYSTNDVYFIDNKAQDLQVEILIAGFDKVEFNASSYEWLSYNSALKFGTNSVITVSALSNESGIQREGSISAKYTKDGNVTSVEIPIIQSENILFGSEEIFWNNNLITFNN